MTAHKYQTTDNMGMMMDSDYMCMGMVDIDFLLTRFDISSSV